MQRHKKGLLILWTIVHSPPLQQLSTNALAEHLEQEEVPSDNGRKELLFSFVLRTPICDYYYFDPL